MFASLGYARGSLIIALVIVTLLALQALHWGAKTIPAGDLQKRVQFAPVLVSLQRCNLKSAQVVWTPTWYDEGPSGQEVDGRPPRQALRLSYDYDGHRIELLEARQMPGESKKDVYQILGQGYFDIPLILNDELAYATFSDVHVLLLWHGADRIDWKQVYHHLTQMR